MASRSAALLAPPLALMAVIWFFSSQPDLSSGLGVIDLVGRKLIHAAEYGLLCFLWWRAFSAHRTGDVALAAAFVVAVAYGAVDEYHQTYVAGRTGSPIDVAIDAAGAALAAVLIRRGRGRAAARRHRAGPDAGGASHPSGSGAPPPGTTTSRAR